MKNRRDTIMVALRSLDRSSDRLLRKAAALAKARRCDLELVHIVALPYVPAVSRRADLRQAAGEIIEDCRRRLIKLAASSQLRGLKTNTVVAWDYPAADGLVRHVLKRRPMLLLAESHRHARLARPFLSNTDWELIRKCPCPVWLSKSTRSTPGGRVLAALDPLHAHAKPAALDEVILRHALEVAGDPKRLLACHAYVLPAPPISDGVVEAYWIGLSEEEIKRHESELKQHLERLTDAYRIPPKNRLLAKGDPASVLPRMARKHRASLVVMGAVSRTALARLFVGHTAERVIDALDCDVLIVKPHGFKTNVAKHAHRAVPLPSI